VSNPADGDLNPRQIEYLAGHEQKNRSLENDLRLAVAESYVNLAKRYAEPKGMFTETLRNIDVLLQIFDAKHAQAIAPDLAQQALYKIPCRYWRRDRYTPERQAKWGWLIERVLRLDDLPDAMDAAVNSPDVQTKLKVLRQALVELETEIAKLPDPETMDFDTMLEQVLVVMEKEKARLTAEGVDMKKQSKELNKNPF
jgi:hypothetical protein